jgi:hypothetical protein
MLSIKSEDNNQFDNLSDHQHESIQALATNIENLNAAMRQAVDAGLSIELQRTARHHHASGFWGDLVSPQIVKRS